MNKKRDKLFTGLSPVWFKNHNQMFLVNKLIFNFLDTYDDFQDSDLLWKYHKTQTGGHIMCVMNPKSSSLYGRQTL